MSGIGRLVVGSRTRRTMYLPLSYTSLRARQEGIEPSSSGLEPVEQPVNYR